MGLLFFFQAEDGIRDTSVTGVQTCALPISWTAPRRCNLVCFPPRRDRRRRPWRGHRCLCLAIRSEERRVGKSVGLGGRRIIKKQRADKHVGYEQQIEGACQRVDRLYVCHAT